MGSNEFFDKKTYFFCGTLQYMGQIHIYIIHKYVFAQYWCFEIIMISGALPWRWLHERHLRGRHGQESLEMDKKLYFGQQIQFSVVE